jgi:hypothetical protein
MTKAKKSAIARILNIRLSKSSEADPDLWFVRDKLT